MSARISTRTGSQVSMMFSEAELPSTHEFQFAVEQIRLDLEEQHRLAMAELRDAMNQSMSNIREELRQEFAQLEQPSWWQELRQEFSQLEQKCVTQTDLQDAIASMQKELYDESADIQQRCTDLMHAEVDRVEGQFRQQPQDVSSRQVEVCSDEKLLLLSQDLSPEIAEEIADKLQAMAPEMRILQATSNGLWEVLQSHTQDLLTRVQADVDAACTSAISENMQRLEVDTSHQQAKLEAKCASTLLESCSRYEQDFLQAKADAKFASLVADHVHRLEAEVRVLQSNVHQCRESKPPVLPVVPPLNLLGHVPQQACRSVTVHQPAMPQQPALPDESRRPNTSREFVSRGAATPTFQHLVAQFETAAVRNAESQSPSPRKVAANVGNVMRRATLPPAFRGAQPTWGQQNSVTLQQNSGATTTMTMQQNSVTISCVAPRDCKVDSGPAGGRTPVPIEVVTAIAGNDSDGPSCVRSPVQGAFPGKAPGPTPVGAMPSVNAMAG